MTGDRPPPDRHPGDGGDPAGDAGEPPADGRGRIRPTRLGALGRMLPPDTGRSAREDVERLARHDLDRTESDGDRPGRDVDRLRLRGTNRAGRPPQRVRVTSPRMTATPRAPARSVSREIDEQTGVGEVYLRSLLGAQLRIGLSVIAVIALTLGALPLVFAVVPPLGSIRLVMVPLPWLLIGVGVYPLLFGVAWWQVLAAERAERDFVALVESD